MKRLLTKCLVAVLSAAMLIGCVSAFTGCGKSAKYKIGILLYNFTDIQGQEISAYADYLEEDFDVEFVKVSVGQDDDSHIQGLESCLNQGCNAVFSGYNTAIDTCVEMCEEAGVYYGLILGDTQTTELSEKTLTSKYYLGGVKQFSGDPSKVGKQFAELLNGSEYTEIAGLSFPPFAFIDGTTLWNAMVEDLGEGKQIKSAENEAMPFPFNYKGDYFYFMFTADACNAEVQKMFSKYPDIEVLVAMGSGMDYILPALRQYNHTDVKMLCLGYNDDTMQYMQDGTLLAAGTNNYVQCMASMFARAYDALESDGAAWYSDRPAATAENYQYNGADGAADYTIMTSVAEVEDFENYIVCDDKGNGPINNEELKQCMLSFNEDATWAQLTELTTRTLGQIKAARTAA